MATVRDQVLPVLATIRGPIIDTVLGLRRFAVYLRVRTPSDGVGGAGATWTTVDTPVVEKPRIRKANANDVASSGGVIETTDYIADHITPLSDSDPTVGKSILQWRLTPPAGGKVYVVLVGDGFPAYVTGGPNGPVGGALFTVVMTDSSKNFQDKVALRPATGFVSGP